MAPSSAQTSPSQMAMNAPSTQPSIACGPPIAMTTSGRVMNGPTPIMFIMLSESALPKLTWRVRDTGDDDGGGLASPSSGLFIGNEASSGEPKSENPDLEHPHLR